ncbi:MAG: hypothetical protein ABII64_00335 [Elusimicrobiota bacterium]
MVVLKNVLKMAVVFALAQGCIAGAEEPGRKAMKIGREGTVLDSFNPIEKWQTIVAPQATLTIDGTEGFKGESVCLNYGFAETNGYVLISKDFQIDLPPNFEFSFYIKRSMPENNFEFKLIDDKGNTFWKKFYVFAQVNKWKKHTIRKDEFTFAWGPNPDGKLEKVAKIEFVVSGIKTKGRVAMDELTLAELPVSAASAAAPAKAENDFYPRWIANEQAFWTMTGSPDDDNEILVCEDGTLEPHKRGFTLAPALFVDKKLITRNTAKVTQSLEKSYLPIPAVKWNYKDIELDMKTFAAGIAGKSAGYARYAVKNNGKKKVSGKFFLAINPYQVFPPWQGGGGISLIKKIDYAGGFIDIDGKYRVYPLTKPDKFSAQAEKDSSPEGNAIDGIIKGKITERKSASDESGFASAALEYDFSLKPGESREIYIYLPLYYKQSDFKEGLSDTDIKKLYDDKLKETVDYWESKVNNVEINIPDKELVDSFKANIAYNLITKDGPGLQPGCRSYDKSWMRDGGIAAIAILEAGLTKEAKEFIEWFATFQQESGEIPPIIDTKAEDPLWEEKQNNLIEYDSQGEYIWAVMQYYLFTKDRAFLEKMFPSVEKAVKFLIELRSRRLTDEYKNGPDEKRIFYGILPESTSHEGYYLKHSYWDDLWAIRGWQDAKMMAEILGKNDTAAWIDKEYADFRKCLYDSMNLVIKLNKLEYIPGCAELADFDPTSAAAWVTYAGEMNNVPQAQLKSGFDRYYAELQTRFGGKKDYRFTPYEFRSVPALLFMGQKDRMWDLINFMMKCRRPLGWNHWAEVVNSKYRYPDYFGDMPHTWVGAEFIHAVRCMFVYESDGSLVLGAGIDGKWLAGADGISVKNMPTHYGAIGYSAKKDGDTVTIKVAGAGAEIPPAGYVFKLPDIGEIKSVSVNGVASPAGNNVVFKSLPAEIVVTLEK